MKFVCSKYLKRLTVYILVVTCVVWILLSFTERTLKSEESGFSRYRDSEHGDLLTMFTTFRTEALNISQHYSFVHSVCILNWASLLPRVQPVLFARSLDSPLARMAAQNNWTVLPITRSNPSGAPYLRDMYAEIETRFQSTFVGFTNGDIIFDSSLISTLDVIKANLSDPLNNNTFIIGSRTNVDVQDYTDMEMGYFSDGINFPTFCSGKERSIVCASCQGLFLHEPKQHQVYLEPCC